MAGKFRSVRAYHESGHAVITRKFALGITHASALSTAPAVVSESAAWLATNLDVSARIEAYEKDAMVALAGLAAQRLPAQPPQNPKKSKLFHTSAASNIRQQRSNSGIFASIRCFLVVLPVLVPVQIDLAPSQNTTAPAIT